MAASARAAPRTIRDQFFKNRPQSMSLGPPATGVVPSKGKTVRYFKRKDSMLGEKGARVASIAEPSKLSSASLDPALFEPVRITVKREVVSSSAGGNSGGDVPEWQPRWDKRFGEGWGPYSALVNLLLNAELMTAPGSLKKHGGYVSDEWDGTDQCPPQPDSLVCHIDNVYTMSGQKAVFEKRTAHSLAERASHSKKEVRLVPDTLDISAFAGVDASNEEGTVVPDSTVTNLGTGRNIHGRDANDKEFNPASQWEDTHMHVVTQMQMEGAAKLSTNCHATDCDLDGIEVSYRYESGHTAVKRIPAVKFWETLDETGWREEDFDVDLKLFSDEPLRQLFEFPRPEDVASVEPIEVEHKGAFAHVKKRNQELKQKKMIAEMHKRKAAARAEAKRGVSTINNAFAELTDEEWKGYLTARHIAAKLRKQQTLSRLGFQPLPTEAEVRHAKIQYKQDLRNHHQRILNGLPQANVPEVMAGDSNCKVEVKDDSKAYQDYWTLMVGYLDEVRYQAHLAKMDVHCRHRVDQSVELSNRYKRQAFFNSHLYWGLEKTPGFTIKQLLQIKKADAKRWFKRKEIAAWKKEQLKDRRFMEAANKVLDWEAPYDTGYRPTKAVIEATTAALCARILTEGTAHDEDGEYLHLARLAGIVEDTAQEVPKDFWDDLALRMMKEEGAAVETDGGVLVPNKAVLFEPKDVVFLDALGTPLTK